MTELENITFWGVDSYHLLKSHILKLKKNRRFHYRGHNFTAFSFNILGKTTLILFLENNEKPLISLTIIKTELYPCKI